MAIVYGKKTRLILPFPLLSRTAATYLSDASAMPEAFDEAIVYINATVLTGTLDVNYQISPDNGTTWHTRSSAVQVTAVGQSVMTIPDNIGRFFRLRAVVATGPITFSAAVEFKRTGEG